jgi:hypothetical protein
MHPRSKHWHLIDYIIVRRRDRQDVNVTKAMCGADCWTDHRLVISKMKLRIIPKRRPQGCKAPKRIDVSKLKNSGTTEELVKNLETELADFSPEDNVESDWERFRNTVHTTASRVLGSPMRRRQDWFDENDAEIQALLAEKHRLHCAYQNDPSSAVKKAAFVNIRRTVQNRLRKMQDDWLSAKADEIQLYADKNDHRRFYEALNTLYGPQSSGSSPVLNADGTTILTEKTQILQRWAEHFEAVLNRPSIVNDEAIDKMPQVAVNDSMSAPPDENEVKKAISQLSSGKAPGADAIPTEIYKAGGPVLIHKFTELLQSLWKQGSVPQDFRDATIIHLYKRKGSRQVCDNHRGISLLSTAGKALARILLNRLTTHLENGLLPETQCGFRKGRGTIDMIFAARQLQEKCQEQNRMLYTTFVDLTKAFDSVSRQGLWRIMSKFGCPEKFIQMVQQLHDGMMARVLNDGETSAAFPITNGVKQGCVLAPTLFSMVLSATLTDAFQDCTEGIGLKFRTDGSLFNLRRLRAVTKVKETIVRDFLFADDCALNANTEPEMQAIMDKFSASCTNFGLTINAKKTEVMHQPAPRTLYSDPCITVNGQRLQAVDQFTYLGSTLSRSVTIDAEINCRIAKASAAFGRLRIKVWDRRGISLPTKLKVYRAVILPTLLYACETWTVYRSHARRLNHFHLSCLRKVLKIKWQDKIPDSEVLTRAGLPSIHTLLVRAQTKWAGHVLRMPEERIPKQLLYGELSQGKRSRGGQKKRFKDTLKASLNSLQISTVNWETLALDRPKWRSLVNTGCHTMETRRTAEAERKREWRKSRADRTISMATSHSCPDCNRTCNARIGLLSHIRSHKTSATNG